MGKNWLIILLSMILFEFSLFSVFFFCVATVVQRYQLFFLNTFTLWRTLGTLIGCLLAILSLFLASNKVKARRQHSAHWGARAPVNDKNRKAQ